MTVSPQRTIETDLVKGLVEDQFPQSKDLSIKPVADDGHDNRTFHLGEDMLVRIPSSEHYAAAVEKKQQCLPRLAPHLPVPIPAPLATRIARRRLSVVMVDIQVAQRRTSNRRKYF